MKLPRAFTMAAASVLVAVICAAMFVAIAVTKRADEAQRELQQDIVLRGADAISLSFNTALKREWDSLHAVANNIGTATRDEIDHFMDAVLETGDRVAWAGVADLDGRIISGSNGLREGQDVSERRWYREGLRHPSVGSAFFSETMARSGGPQREALLNLSTPVHDASGETTGVVVYSLRMAWVESFLAAAKDELRIDVVVQDRNGKNLIDTRPSSTPLPADVTTVARLGQSAAGSFQLGAQGEALFAFTPNFIQDKLPDFGWRVFAVLDRQSHTDVLPGLLKSIVFAVAIAAAFVLAVTYVALRILFRPLESLAGTADDVARGAFEYPVESRSSREASQLSQALVRIQSELAALKALHPSYDGPHFGVIGPETEVRPAPPRVAAPTRARTGTSGSELRNDPRLAPSLKRAGSGGA